MHNRGISLVLLGVSCGLSSLANAAGEPLSYSAGGTCYCNVSASNALGNKRVSTPIGGQSVSQVCERIGEGPKLTSNAGSYNYPVFDDVQCGHGPGMPGFKGLLSSSDNADNKGPQWDLISAYAGSGEKTNTGKSVAQTATAKDVGGGTDSNTRTKKRFKSRYVKRPASSNQSEPAETIAAAKSSPVEPAAAAAKPKLAKPVEPAVAAAKPELAKPVEPAVAAAEPKLAKPVEPAVAAAKPKLPERKNIGKLNKPQFEEKIIAIREVERDVKQTAPPVAKKSEKAVVKALTPNPKAGVTKVPVSNALSLAPSVRSSSQDFNYVSVLPIGYDFGGGGLQVAGSYKPADKFRFIGRAGVANSYQEVLLGASYVFVPQNARRISISFTSGIEFGQFTINGQGVETTDSETGVFGRFESRYVLNRSFELLGGLGFSSFFEGDPHAFGGASYHITRNLDITGEVEVGDNDSLGLGIRYFY